MVLHILLQDHDEHTSSVKKLRRNLEPRSDSDNESDRDIDILEEL